MKPLAIKPTEASLQSALSGNRPLVIPVFLPQMGCRHRCVFCNQAAVSSRPARLPTLESLDRLVHRHLQRSRLDRRWYRQVAFYGGNFLGLGPAVVRRLLAWAQSKVAAGTVDGIRFSTRPDTIDRARLQALEPYGVDTVELGVQSMDDTVLAAAERGHSAACTATACALLRESMPTAQLGLQLMVGLPEETDASLEYTTARIIELQPDFVRIHPTLVLTGTRLARLLRQGRYRPLDLEQAVEKTADIVERLTAAGIRVVRMGLQADTGMTAPGAILAGPWHPAFGHLVQSRLCRRMIDRHLAATGEQLARLAAPARLLSVVGGQRNANLAYFCARHDRFDGRILLDPTLPPDTVAVNGRRLPLAWSRAGRHATWG